jgi:hypothetical protein
LATTVAGSDATLGNILVETPDGNITANQGGIVQISFNGTDASAATTYLLAGYELLDATGQHLLTASDISALDTLKDNSAGAQYAANLVNGADTTIGELVDVSPNENINANGSGIIGRNVALKATGKIEGHFVSFGNLLLDAPILQNIVGIGKTITAISDAPTPILLVSDSPTSLNGQIVPPDAPSTQAPVAQVAPQAATATTVASNTNDSDDEKKKKSKQVALAQKVSRVTVTLPQKINPKT